ncbi:endonuclease/exonuclease/phosphatase family protein [Haloarchaeobius sp. DT45]|uniref:endonuclease/exonuclease/phosphatase family protein n=1 Tax=Haloarchaeobius sp. DT45 TaxID=3446116 RepID=UPI003F6B6F9E
MSSTTSRTDSLLVAFSAAALVVVTVAAFEQTVSRIYLLNFSLGGPNATALLLFLLATAWILPVVDATGARRDTLLAVGSLTVPVLVAVSMVTPPAQAALATLGVQFVVLPLFVVALRRSPESVTPGVVTGLLVLVAARNALGGSPAYATTVGQGLLLAVAVGVTASTVWQVRDGLPAESVDTVDLGPLALFVFVEAAFLGTPSVLATWQLRSYELTAGAAVAGLVVGTGYLALRGVPGRRTSPLLGGLFLLSLADLLWLDLVGPLAALPAQALAVGLLAQGVAGARASSRGWPATLGLQFLAVVVLFLHVSALNAEYMPGPVFALTHGRAAHFLFVLGALLPLAVLAQGLRVSHGFREPASGQQPTPDPVRRSAMTAVGAAALGAGTLSLSSRTGSASAPDGTEVTAMTYNVHQFLAGDRGEYNLDEVLGVIEQSGAHVVGLQESEGNRITSGNVDGVRWLADRLGYHYHYGAPTSAASYGVAILSVWPVVDSEVVSLPTYQSPPRLALRVTLDTPAGDLPVVVTHLQTQQEGTPEAIEMQGEEANAVVELAGTDADAVVLGDFNVEPGTDPAYTVMADSFSDAWVAAGNAEQGGGTWPAADPTMRIDYVWTADGWSVTDAAAHGDGEDSDHRAVTATLRR